jgi:two-component system, sensor histidine kinase
MKTFSTSAQAIIDRTIGEYTRPLCVILDRDFMVKSWSGDCSYYGFDGIEVGKDCRDSMLFLVGLDTQDSIQFQFIETPNARTVHLQLFFDSDEMVLVLLDATEQRVNYEAIQQKGYELAIMHVRQLKLIANLKRLEKEVELKRRQAEQANLLKGRFIATMSHEFRTPLTSILGYAARLKQRDDFDPTALKYLGSVERGAQHLLSLVENLLDHSQIEANSLAINPIATNISVVIVKLFSIFEPLAEDKHLELHVDIQSEIPEYLFLDEMRFRQILVNLISNAIKFTAQGSVLIKINWAKDELIVCVEDTGKGIAEADQKRAFTAFEQLGNHPGTGLGLSIVKHLVTSMGGKILLISSVGSGSRFEVALPAKQVKLRAEEDQKELRENNLRKKAYLKSVLLVEDDPDIMGLLQSIFEDAEYPVLTATNGNDAINIALSDWPDLILLDLHLPDITGFEVIKTLRNNNFHNPVFAQSAWASSEYKVKAIAAGCNEYLVKPLDVTELKMWISDYFIDATDSGMPVERYQQLCQRFLGSLPEKQKNLQQLGINIGKHNWDSSTRQELHNYAHRLAGSASLYGMHPIARTSGQLDQLLLDYDRLKPQDDTTAELREKIMSAIALLDGQFQQAISKG